jgi:putative ABC transport system ATP-binding protein
MIRAEQVGKVYGQGAERVVALDAVDVSVERGELVGLVGPSGSGKTTLLNILGCLDRPSSGSVHFDGRDLFALDDAALTRFRATSLGFVFQSFNLFELLSAAENVEYPLELKGMAARERRRLAAEALERVGLDAKGDRRPHQLSGGEKQRVAIARALVHRPALVLADEPTANLDSETSERIVGLLRELNRQLGATFVIATHDPALIARLGRVVSIRDGRVTD